MVPCEYRNLGTSFADIALLGDLRTQYVNSTAERPYSAPAVLCIFGPPAERRQPVLFNYSRRGTYQIRRKSKPLGIKITEDGFQSEMAARFAGKRALADFLSDLQREEKRKLGRLSWRPISQCGSTQVARA